MDFKVSKDKHIGRWVDRENLIYVSWNNIKTVHNTKEVIDRGKRNETLNETKPVKNINKNLQSFLEINPMQKEVLPSHKQQDHIYSQ